MSGSRSTLAAAILATMTPIIVCDDAIGGDRYSRHAQAEDRARAEAKAARETWDNPPEGESRQVRRARERKAGKAPS